MHWDQYWNSTEGFSSFAELKTQFGYPQEVLKLWENTLLNAEDKELKILDLATGKGVLAIWLKMIAVKKHYNIDVFACDAANLDVNSIRSNDQLIMNMIKQIEFSFSTKLENLPYKTDYFDLAVSQFGFEYSSWDLSLKELCRVLKKGGRAILVVHSKDSPVTCNSRAGIYVMKVLIKMKLFEQLEDLVRIKISKDSHEFNVRNKELIANLNRLPLGNEHLEWFQDIIKNISYIMRNINSNSLLAIEKLKINVNYQLHRLEEQVSASLTKNEIYKAFDKQNNKLKLENVSSLIVEEEHFAWVVSCEAY